MEKSLPSGTNMETLKKEWQEYREIPFPSIPQEDDYLLELHGKLALTDTHVSGIVSSFIKGHKAEKKLIYIDDDFNKKLNTFKPMDPATERIWNAMRSYKDKLDRMVKILLALYDNT